MSDMLQLVDPMSDMLQLVVSRGAETGEDTLETTNNLDLTLVNHDKLKHIGHSPHIGHSDWGCAVQIIDAEYSGLK